jgi:chaperonin GroEL
VSEGALITTAVMITDRPKKDAGPSMPGGGMGGMGDMDF